MNNNYWDYLAHSSKGSIWKNHKYIRKEGNRYIYKENKTASGFKVIGKKIGEVADNIGSGIKDKATEINNAVDAVKAAASYRRNSKEANTECDKIKANLDEKKRMYEQHLAESEATIDKINKRYPDGNYSKMSLYDKFQIRSAKQDAALLKHEYINAKIEAIDSIDSINSKYGTDIDYISNETKDDLNRQLLDIEKEIDYINSDKYDYGKSKK